MERKKKKLVKAITLKLTEEQFQTISTYAESAMLRRANWIKNILFTGKFPKLIVSSLDASIYRELKMIRIALEECKKTSQPQLTSDLDQTIELLIGQQQAIIKKLLS